MAELIGIPGGGAALNEQASSTSVGGRCSRAAERALAYVASRVLDEIWVAKHTDVTYYFRAPLALLEAGRKVEAGRALGVAARFASQGGEGSANEIYSKWYPQCPLLWICCAAMRLGQMELANECFRGICKYAHPLTSTGLVSAPYRWQSAFVADFFATAILAKAALMMGDTALAVAAGDSLLRALAVNRKHMSSGRFFLRWTWSNGFVEETDPLHCVLQRGTGQLYFMLGLPVAVLLELGGSQSEYRAGATELLRFLKGCDGVFSSPVAHQVAAAAAMANDLDTGFRIAEHLLSLQSTAGCFHEEADGLNAVDQAAEISICLRHVVTDWSSLTTTEGVAASRRRGVTEEEQERPAAETLASAPTVLLSVTPKAVGDERRDHGGDCGGGRGDRSGGDGVGGGECPVTAGGALAAGDKPASKPAVTHLVAPVTLSKPAWCQECGSFLWGFSEQGVRCLRCLVVVCPRCETSWAAKPCMTPQVGQASV